MGDYRGYSAAQLELRQQGKKVGGITGFSAVRDTQFMPERELGSLSDVGHAPVRRTVRGTFDQFVIRNNSVMAQGLVQRTDSAVLTASSSNFELYDRINQRTAMMVYGFRVESENYSVQDGSIMMSNGTFVAIALTDETEPVVNNP